MSNIRNYIHHSNKPVAPPGQGGQQGQDTEVQTPSTRDVFSYLLNLRPPLWTVLGGEHASGVSRLLEEIERHKTPGASNLETMRIVLPDEESKPKKIDGEITRQMLELFKELRRTLLKHQVVLHSQSRHRKGRSLQLSLLRDPKFENLFGEVRELMNKQPVRRLVIDNTQYIRQDTLAVKRLFQLRRVVDHPFAIIFGIRLESRSTKGAVEQFMSVPGAKDTFEQPQTLYRPPDDQIIQPILFDLLRSQYAKPGDDLIDQVAAIDADMKRAVAQNWIRLDVLAMKIDQKLRETNPEQRTKDRPGILTYPMLRAILDEMLLRG